MAKKQQKDPFWTSYSDLMTSLFFVMLVLFIICLIKVGHDKEVIESQYQEAINDWNSEENRAERYNRFTEGLLKITEGIPPNKVTKIIQEIEAQAW